MTALPPTVESLPGEEPNNDTHRTTPSCPTTQPCPTSSVQPGGREPASPPPGWSPLPSPAPPATR